MKTRGGTFQNHEKSGWALWGRPGGNPGGPQKWPPPDPPFWTPRRRTPPGTPKNGGYKMLQKRGQKGGTIFFRLFSGRKSVRKNRFCQISNQFIYLLNPPGNPPFPTTQNQPIWTPKNPPFWTPHFRTNLGTPKSNHQGGALRGGPRGGWWPPGVSPCVPPRRSNEIFFSEKFF